MSDDSGEDAVSNMDMTRRTLSSNAVGKRKVKAAKLPKRDVTHTTKEYAQRCVSNPKLLSKVCATTIVETKHGPAAPTTHTSVTVYHEVCDVPSGAAALPSCYDCLCVGIARQAQTARDLDWEAKFSLAAAQRRAAAAVLEAYERRAEYQPPPTPPVMVATPYAVPYESDAVAPPAATPITPVITSWGFKAALELADAGQRVTDAQAAAARQVLRDTPDALGVGQASAGLVRAVLRSRPVGEAVAAGADVFVDYFQRYQVRPKGAGALPGGAACAYGVTVQQLVEILEDVGVLTARPAKHAGTPGQTAKRRVARALAAQLLAKMPPADAPADAGAAAAAASPAAKGGKPEPKKAAAGKPSPADAPPPPEPPAGVALTREFLEKIADDAAPAAEEPPAAEGPPPPAGGVASLLRVCLWFTCGVDADAWYKLYSREEKRVMALRAQQEDARRHEQLVAAAQAAGLAANAPLGSTVTADAHAPAELRVQLLARDETRMHAAWFPPTPPTVPTMSDAWVTSVLPLPLVYHEFLDMLVLAAAVCLRDTAAAAGAAAAIHEGLPQKVAALVDAMQRFRDTDAWGARQRAGGYCWDGR
eukprot:TRINITY_DN16007_c2_g1_i1.p1 TRINITY_DN16007_c2_g1~~TRINITY_DN16007_c2_g1_i1.p1  ORF type:complete len:623 (+),score=240.17 TRINITY_DN16007_c2_g1_i1:98-1870(+)